MADDQQAPTSDPVSAESAAGRGIPQDHDGWEPGPPALRSILPSAIGGAVVPLAVYYLVRSHVHSDADALAIAGIPAAIWVAAQFVRRRRIDPIGAIVLGGFVLGLIVSFALGGNAFVLKVRDSAFTFGFGLAAIVSGFSGRRPLTYFVGRALSAGSNPRRVALYDQLWELAPARATFRIINLVWGFGLMLEASARVVLAADLSTKTFLAVSPVVSFGCLGVMGALTVSLSTRSRHRAPLVDPATVPAGGGGTWWWLRVYLGEPPRALAEPEVAEG
ncbi:MAG TPA: VC0807 family protein [Acidimicrobiales bacterium]|nr:VC0807 family protein [Acidimicrobiales bacterium]